MPPFLTQPLVSLLFCLFCLVACAGSDTDSDAVGAPSATPANLVAQASTESTVRLIVQFKPWVTATGLELTPALQAQAQVPTQYISSSFDHFYVYIFSLGPNQTVPELIGRLKAMAEIQGVEPDSRSRAQ